MLFWELCECLIISITIIVSFYRALPCLFACKKSTSSLTSFLRYCKEIANLLFWEIWACLATHTQNDGIIWRNRWHSSTGKKSTSSFMFSLRYCKDIGNLLCVIWACLATHTQSGTITLQKTFVFICRQKNHFHPSCFSRNANLFWVLWYTLVIKMILSTCRRLHKASKNTLIHSLFYWYIHILKNLEFNWLTSFGPSFENQNFPKNSI